ncbi:MAG: DUF3293 domain-containing protein [Planctomycetota bacterium]|jgi:hypothetical protein
MTDPIPPELLGAYEETWVEVELDEGRFTFAPVREGAPRMLPTVLSPHGFVITACNPFSQRLDEDENERRNGELEARMREEGWSIFPALGRDAEGEWREPSFAVVAPPVLPLLKLAREYEQNSVFEWGPGIWRVVVI